MGHALSVRAVAAAIADKAPLTIDEYDVLLCIQRSIGGRIRLSQLAEDTVYTKSGITRILKRFEEVGYVVKKTCSEDGRGSYAELTDRGRRALGETWKHYSTAVIELLSSCFTTHEAEELQTYLARVVDKLQSNRLVQISKK